MRKIAVFILSLQISLLVWSQQSQTDIREEVYLHINKQELISGETLLYAAFVRSQKTGQLSILSRILYVELLDQSGNPVHQSKILLEQGRGNGEYFVPSSIATGNYHLVAYTRWMKNFNDFYYQPLTIINPFEDFPKTESEQESLSVSFYPEAGNLIADEKNRLLIEAKSGYQAAVISGRLVDTDGKQIDAIKTDDAGLASISFIPEAGEKYQLITENEQGEFQFFDIKDPCKDCVGLSVSSFNDQIIVKVSGSNANQGKLRIRDQQNVWKESSLRTSSSFRFDRRDLATGLYLIEWLVSEKVIASRFYYIDNKQTELPKDLGTFNRRTRVSWQPDLSQRVEVSLSVHAKQDNKDKIDPELLVASRGKIRDRRHINELLLIDPPEAFAEGQDAITYLPETRFDFVSGSVQETEMKQLPVALSLPGDDFQFQIRNTDSSGVFNIGLQPVFEDRNAYLKVVGEEESITITLDDEFYTTYPAFYNAPLVADSVQIAQWVQRSIKNQIENAYYEIRPDSILPVPPSVNQFENNSNYMLDDYTRFPTLRDTFIEYIPEVGVRKNESDYRMNIRLNKRFLGERFPSLVLLDGLPVQNHEILDITPYAFERINILNQRFYFGEVVIDGIIAFETIARDYAGINTNALQFSHKGLDRLKIYSFPNHSQTTNNLPDYRTQLYWEPAAVLNPGETIEFYTSDLPGNYEVILFGVDKAGNEMIRQAVFTVK